MIATGDGRIARSAVFLPGHMCDERLFGEQILALSEIGVSSSVAPLSSGDSVKALASAVLETAPPRFALVGLSLGGIVAFEIMRQQAERVTHLALLDTNARPESEERQKARERDMEAVREGRLAEVTRAAKSAYLGPEQPESEGLRSLLARMSHDLGEEVYAAQAQALLDRPDSRPTLPGIRCPTLILGGRDDRLCPPAIQMEMGELVPHADVVLLGRCGHLSPLERPDAVSGEIVRLLLRPPEGRN